MSREERDLADAVRAETAHRESDERSALETVFEQAVLYHRLKHPTPEIIPPEVEAFEKQRQKQERKQARREAKKKKKRDEVMAVEQRKYGMVVSVSAPEPEPEAHKAKKKKKGKHSATTSTTAAADGEHKSQPPPQVSRYSHEVSTSPWFAVVPKRTILSVMSSDEDLKKIVNRCHV
jgi:hypothetical protein